MNLNDQALADLATMHNIAEFANTLTITSDDGSVSVPCILDEELAKVEADGVREWNATLYVRASDLPIAPVVGQRLELVGDDIGTRSASVVHTNTIHGERVIRLRWFES